MGGPVGLQPLLGVDLVRADDGPDVVVEDLGGGAGQGPQSGIAQGDEVVGQGHLGAPGTLGHLEGGEPVDVDGR